MAEHCSCILVTCSKKTIVSCIVLIVKIFTTYTPNTHQRCIILMTLVAVELYASIAYACCSWTSGRPLPSRQTKETDALSFFRPARSILNRNHLSMTWTVHLPQLDEVHSICHRPRSQWTICRCVDPGGWGLDPLKICRRVRVCFDP